VSGEFLKKLYHQRKGTFAAEELQKGGGGPQVRTRQTPKPQTSSFVEALLILTNKTKGGRRLDPYFSERGKRGDKKLLCICQKRRREGSQKKRKPRTRAIALKTQGFLRRNRGVDHFRLVRKWTQGERGEKRRKRVERGANGGASI